MDELALLDQPPGSFCSGSEPSRAGNALTAASVRLRPGNGGRSVIARSSNTRSRLVITSKLTSKAPTTIPQPIRAALRLREGDELVYEIQGNRVVLSKAQPVRDGDAHSGRSVSGIRLRIAGPMAGSKQGDVVKAPFPCTDRSSRRWRPALVVSTGPLEDHHRLAWVAMITSAENRGWSGDVPTTDLSLVGLPAPSLIRTAKIATSTRPMRRSSAKYPRHRSARCLRQSGVNWASGIQATTHPGGLSRLCVKKDPLSFPCLGCSAPASRAGRSIERTGSRPTRRVEHD